MSGIKEQLNTFENLARTNQWEQLERKLSTVEKTQLSEKDSIQLAILARRAYQLNLAISILKPFVLIGNNLNKNANPKALTEYATCLTMHGGREIAQSILTELPLNSPEVLFSWITLHFASAQYSKAIPYLKKIIDTTEDPYQKNLAELNLCSCLVFLGLFDEAHGRIASLRQKVNKDKSHILHANLEELQCQIYIHQKKWGLVHKNIELAKTLTNNQNPLYSLFINKWELIYGFSQKNSNQEDLLKFTEQARQLGHHYSIREAFFFWSYFKNDEDLLKKIFYGTPYEDYRNFMTSRIGKIYSDIEIPWNGQFFNNGWSKALRIENQPLDKLSLSSQEQKILTTFTDDFFEPLSIESLFYRLYPNEYFDSDYSTPKTYKAVQRLNKKLTQAEVSIQIANSGAKYYLKIDQGWMIPKYHPELQSLSLSSKDLSLCHRFHGSPFSREDVMNAYSLKKNTSLRWLKKLKEKGVIKKIGSGPGAFYEIVSISKK